jgi:predicted nucleic acid-binding protein
VPVFVDTNVLVYARDATEGEKRAGASAWLTHLWENRTGRLNYQVLEEYYVTVTRKLRPGLAPADARADVRDLLAWGPLPLDAEVLESAWRLESRWDLSFWDAAIVAAARASGCEHLLTEVLTDGQTMGGVTVLNPFVHAPGSADG